jgi:5'-deoxynucleotidase YfbR-like HD superfamily hydrolase
MKNTKNIVKKETRPEVPEVSAAPMEENKISISGFPNEPLSEDHVQYKRVTVDPFDSTLLGHGIPNYALDPVSCNAVAYPPLDTPENLEALNAAFKVTSQMDTQQKLTDDAWIQTYSGRKFYPLDPHIDSIVIQDIAHALSNICRFTGHCKEFYSVAQHSVLVSYICNEENALWGLLHDQSEAYAQDLPKPLKCSPEFATYREIEKRIQKAGCQRFGLSEQEPTDVKKADILLLATEARDLMSPLHPDWKSPVEPLPFRIEPWEPARAKTEFLKRFYQLFSSK